MSELFDRVDAPIASRSPLLDEVAEALQVRRVTVSARESGKTESRPP